MSQIHFILFFIFAIFLIYSGLAIGTAYSNVGDQSIMGLSLWAMFCTSVWLIYSSFKETKKAQLKENGKKPVPRWLVFSLTIVAANLLLILIEGSLLIPTDTMIYYSFKAGSWLAVILTMLGGLLSFTVYYKLKNEHKTNLRYILIAVIVLTIMFFGLMTLLFLGLTFGDLTYNWEGFG